MVGMLKYTLNRLSEKKTLFANKGKYHPQLPFQRVPSCSHTWLVIHILLYATHVGKLNFYAYTLMYNRYAGKFT